MKQAFVLILGLFILAAGCSSSPTASSTKPEDLCVYIEQPQFYKPGPGMVSLEVDGKYYSCKSQAALGQFKSMKGIK